MRRLGSVLLALVLLSVSTACGGTPAAETVTSPPVQEVKSEAQLAMEAILSRYDGIEESSEEQALLVEKIRLSAEGLQRVEEFFNISLFNYSENEGLDIAYIDYYTDVFASCGGGSIVFSSEKTKLPIPVSMISGYSKNKLYSMINASGNSMAPTIDNGDRLIVEHWSGNQIQDNKIYVFCYNNEFFVKRLSKNLDEIIIKSDNPEYRVRTISGKASMDLILIGKIVATIKQLD